MKTCVWCNGEGANNVKSWTRFSKLRCRNEQIIQLLKSEFDILQLLPRVANDNQVPYWYCPKYSKGTKKNHS